MGSIVPIATQVIGIAKTAATVASVLGATTNIIRTQNDRGNEQALNQLRDQQRLQERQATQAAALDRQEIAIKAEEVESKRRAALKRAVARQRAQFGGAGVSSSGGSSEAVLLGLFDESDEERATRERLDGIRLASIDDNLANRKSINTLQRTQLEQRQKLNALGKTRNAAQDLVDLF